MADLEIVQPADLRKRVEGREVFLWGASIVGFGVCRSLERNGIIPRGFIDSSIRLQGKRALGYPIHRPEGVLDGAGGREPRPFIIITSAHYEHEIAERCLDAGLKSESDFISALFITPLDPSVDISGVCNLHCISCPRGNMEKQPDTGFMKAGTYAQVIDKILEELPFVGSVQLYAWGEPLLNPDVAEIIRMTVERRVLCALSTNLSVRKDFTEAIAARPDWIKVSVSGFGKGYERTHTGGNWELLEKNMRKLSGLRREYHPEMFVEVNYHLYRHNTGESCDRMKAFCEELGFIFKPNYAYLYPLDHIMAYRDGKALTSQARETMDMLLLSIDEGIAKAERQKHLPCPEERCFPIDWNLNVRFCGAYFLPVIAENFLQVPLVDLVRKRNASEFCRKCRSLAIHRFTGVYIEEQKAGDQGKR